MNDIMLYARLKDLGMPADQAWPLAAQIRDTLHPVAHVAAVKLYNAIAPGAGRAGLGSGAAALQDAKIGSSVAGVGVAVASAASLAATGAAFGSVVPVLGTAIGAVVGLIAGMLIHTGQGPQRAAMAQQLDQALATVPSTFVGRTLPWSDARGGLEQFISALMTSGLWMSWDPSVISSPSVNGNWSVTFMNAIKALTAAIINNPVGAQVSVPIVFTPGASGIGPGNFTFTNPGINAGPDAISQSIVMGPSGLMYWMVKHVGETDAHAAANATGNGAQKVYALMIDKATADLLPASLSTTLANAPITQVPAPIAAAATTVANAAGAGGSIPTISTAPGGPAVAQISMPVPLANADMTTGTAVILQPETSALTPVQDTTAALLQQLISQQGANLTSPNATQLLADIAANGVSATPAGPSSMPSWLLPVGLAAAALLAIIFIAKK
jgi:hypothetical protein